MALRLENEFVVQAGVATVWATLVDLERVAQCLPGATIEPADGAGAFRGSMRVKLGPVTVDYKGTAKLENVDAVGYTAVFKVQGKETRGQGAASATITNRLVEAGGSTHVSVETDLSVTGRPAQFGRGIMQDVATAMLTDFSRCLSEMMANSENPGQDDGAVEQITLAEPAKQPETLRLGRFVRRALVARLRGVFRSLHRR